MKIEMIRDSYGANAGFSYGVMKIGNAFFFCCTYTEKEIRQDAESIARILDWSDGKSPVTQKSLRELFAARGLVCETRFDAAHGRRYKLCVYPSDPAQRSEARRVTLAAADDMSDTNAEIARPLSW